MGKDLVPVNAIDFTDMSKKNAMQLFAALTPHFEKLIEKKRTSNKGRPKKSKESKTEKISSTVVKPPKKKPGRPSKKSEKSEKSED